MRKGRAANFVRDHLGNAVNGLFMQKAKRKDRRTYDRYFALAEGKREYFGKSDDLAAAIFRYRKWAAMITGLKVELGLPESGWMRLSVLHGDHSFSIDAAYTPYDWLTGLAHAVSKVAAGIDEVTVPLAEGPGEWDFAFHGACDRISVRITSFPDHSRMLGTGRREFEFQGSRLDVCLAFWRALRRLESQISSDEFERAWRHPFPAEKLEELSKIMQQMKASQPDRRRDGR